MVEKSAVSNRCIICNEEDDITDRREPIYLPDIDSTLPLLRLEDACQSLFDYKVFNDRLHEKIEIAVNRPNVDELLTLDERASIYLYTMEWNDEPHNSFSMKLNHTLRTGDENSLKPWLDYLHLFTSALLKLPSAETTIVYRCVEGHVGDHYKDGSIHVLLSFIACITSLQEFLSNVTIEKYTVFSIKTSTGKLIDKYGGVPGEILLLPGSRFQVVETDNNSYVKSIELSEMSMESIHGQDIVPQDMEIRQRKQKDESQEDANVFQDLTNRTTLNNDDRTNVYTTSNTTVWKSQKIIVTLIISLIVLFILRSLYKINNVDLNKKEQKPIPNRDQYEELLEDGKKHYHGTLLLPDGNKYEGEMIDNIPDGEGVLTSYNGDEYKGSFLFGLKHGYGTLIYLNGDKYVGDWSADKENGHGIKIWSNGDKYEGQWKNGKYNGYGTLVLSNGDKYVGNWTDNKKNGQGIYVWTNDDRYEGQWKNGEPYGNGILVYHTGDKYEGHWEDGKQNGQGVFSWINGDRYSGNWKNDQQHGNGTLIYIIGDKYEGQWENDKKNGFGIYTWINSDRYSGNWENDQQHGYGTYIYHNGDKYEGYWEGGEKNGYGVCTWINGDQYSGSWENNEQHGNGTYVYRNGDKYEGHWKNDQKHGQGTFTWSGGNRYIGNWVNNKMHGYGDIYYTNGEKVMCKWNEGICVS